MNSKTITITSTMTLKKFDNIKIIKNRNILITGTKECGKSFLAKDLLESLSAERTNTNIFSCDPSAKSVYQEQFDKIFDKYDRHKIKDILMDQMYRDNSAKYLVFDDCLCENIIQNSEFMELILNGKLLNITVIIITQNPSILNRFIINNIDYTFLFKIQSNKNKIKNLFNKFDFELIDIISNQLNEDYECTVVENKNCDINSKMFYYESQLNLTINNFDLGTMVENPAILLIGKRGSGKSNIVSRILSELNYHDDNVIIISRTERMNGYYSKLYKNVYCEYDANIIENILERQELLIGKLKRNEISKEDVNIVVVFDDCLNSINKSQMDNHIRELLMSCKNYHVTCIFTIQFPGSIGPDLRSNFDYVFLAAENTMSSLKKMYDYYAGFFPNFYSFKQVHTKLTKNYNNMVICNRSRSNNLFDRIFYYNSKTNINNTNDLNLNYECNSSCDYGCYIEDNQSNCENERRYDECVRENRNEYSCYDEYDNETRSENESSSGSNNSSYESNYSNDSSKNNNENESKMSLLEFAEYDEEKMNNDQVNKMILLRVVDLLENIVNKIY